MAARPGFLASRGPRWREALALAAVLPLLSCLDGTTPNPLRGLTKVSEADERETGAQVDEQFLEILPLVDDPVVLGFVNDLGQDIVRRIEPQPFIYRFRVVVDPNLNAFALPGGYIYFHTGTLMSAGSLDELAGVMAHEIAHVKGRHYARGVEASAIPELLTRLASIGAAVAAESAAPVMIGEGVNVALRLKFTRGFEAEADDLATAFMARSGYDPKGMARFFQRIVDAEERSTVERFEPPPYLYTHPDVEQRVDSALARAEGVTVTGTPGPEMERAFRNMQLRLALLFERGAGALRAPHPDRERSDPFLVEADRLARDGATDAALAALESAADLEPYDARVWARRAEILEEAGQPREAIAAWRRALLLDPEVGLHYYRIGLAYRRLGDRVNATFYLEQAARRFEDGGRLQERTEREIEKLTFPVIRAAGLADGVDDAGADTVAGHSRESFHVSETEAVWWARVGDRYLGERGDLIVRWSDPNGRVVAEGPADPKRRPSVVARLPLRDRAPGTWKVEVTFEGTVVDQRTFEIEP